MALENQRHLNITCLFDGCMGNWAMSTKERKGTSTGSHEPARDGSPVGQSAKISSELSSLIASNPHLQLGLHHRLFNLTQLARFLLPLLRARLKRRLQVSAITMALSRTQRDLPKSFKPKQDRFRLEKLSVHSGLSVLTIEKTRQAVAQAHALYVKMGRAGKYFTLTEGVTQLTLIVDSADLPTVEQALSVPIVAKNNAVGALSASFSKQYIRTPGFLYLVLQQVAVQGINVVEIASTATELILYLDQKDVRLAFDTLYQRFMD